MNIGTTVKTFNGLERRCSDDGIYRVGTPREKTKRKRGKKEFRLKNKIKKSLNLYLHKILFIM
jgi:hypothetical protein